jgi:hypothetical protein
MLAEDKLTNPGYDSSMYDPLCVEEHIKELDRNNRFDRRIVYELTGYKVRPEELPVEEVGRGFADSAADGADADNSDTNEQNFVGPPSGANEHEPLLEQPNTLLN